MGDVVLVDIAEPARLLVSSLQRKCSMHGASARLSWRAAAVTMFEIVFSKR
jgi:hypothetical protein